MNSEDANKDWTQHGAWTKYIHDQVADEIAQLPQDSAPEMVAEALVRAGVQGVNYFDGRKEDDRLGELIAIPSNKIGTEIREWRCKGHRLGGLTRLQRL
jgi:hypothetical protein